MADSSTWKGRTFARVRNQIPATLRDPLELLLAKNSVLRTTGWQRSRKDLAAVDARGEPIPWITYPAIRFLAPRIQQHLKVFEFGSGYSTLWWARRVSQITSVEHDAEWHRIVAAQAPGNVTLLHAKGDEYVRAAIGKKWDIIVNDGICRPDCARNAIDSLAAGGVLIWDNTDEIEDRDGHDFMDQSGFRRIDFWGLGPLMVCESCTTVFYRTVNCLGI
jgi:hypothetical protein